MSRHRAVRNLDLDDELDDDYGYNSDPYEDIDDSDRQQLESAYATILDVLGPPEGAQNPFTQREIKDALWDAYFDVESVLDTLTKEAEKRNRKKQESSSTSTSSIGADLSHLSISSPPPLPMRGRGGRSGRGIGGLTSRGRGVGGGGGRAGLAKRNLAALAPGGLPGVGVDESRSFGPQPGDVGTRSPANAAGMSKLAMMAAQRKAGNAPAPATAAPLSPSKRPSEATAGSSGQQASSSSAPSGARPSKLMALAQGRQKSVPEKAATPTTAAPADAGASAKPLSKLQQRALAAKQEREQKERAAAAAAAAVAASAADGGSPQGEDDVMTDGTAAQPEALLPNGLSASSLFPSRAPSGDHSSAVGRMLAGGGSTSSGEAPHSLPIGLFTPGVGEDDPFEKPSPDDVVLGARSKTKLGKA